MDSGDIAMPGLKITLLRRLTQHDVTNLTEVEQILEDGHLPELEAVRDGVAHQEGGDEVLDGPGLTAVRPKLEGVEAAGLPEVVEDRDVGEHVVQIVRVGWVLGRCPLKGNWFYKLIWWHLCSSS